MNKEREFAVELNKALDEMIVLQELRYKAHKLRGENTISNPLAFAKETVNHFYGLETSNFLIDLYFESKHLDYFMDHVLKHSRGEGYKELQDVRIAAEAYKRAIDAYSKVKDDEAFQEYIKDLEGKV